MNIFDNIIKDIKSFKMDTENLNDVIEEIDAIHKRADEFIIKMMRPNILILNASIRKYYEKAIILYPNLKKLLPFTIINVEYIPTLYCYEIDVSILNKAHVKYIIESEKFNNDVLIDYIKHMVEDLDNEVKYHGCEL